jgi:P4 family phage/plasmid primase-like protien
LYAEHNELTATRAEEETTSAESTTRPGPDPLVAPGPDPDEQEHREGAGRPDTVAEIVNGLRRLTEPGQVVELRALPDWEDNPVFAGIYDTDHLAEMAAEAKRLCDQKGYQGIYFTLNPLNPDLLARRPNRVDVATTGQLTTDGDVTWRRWLLVDVDPERPKGTSATDAEKAQAREVVEKVRVHLRERGWPEPILSDSGNGYHLLYRIDLPADDAGLVRRVLKALAAGFDTTTATIDTRVFNPARICKLPGTLARKGNNLAERPHRLARMLESPEQPEPVSEHLLQALAAEAPEDKKRRPRSGKPGSSASDVAPGNGQPRPAVMLGEDFDKKPIEDRLSPEHLADLRKSGLSDEAIRAGRFHTRHAEEVTRLLGGKKDPGSLGSALVIPYHDAAGNFTGNCRVKPDKPRKDKDGRVIKYEAPAGESPRAYVPAGTIAALKDPTARLIITEGEKKAAKADQDGFPCIGIAGVWNWQKKRPQDANGQRTGERELIDDLDRITWKDRPVLLAFDSDAVTNEAVLWAEWHFAQALTARGALVRIIRLPEGPPAMDGKPTKVGLDDSLATHGPESLRKLILEAGLPEDPRYGNPSSHLSDLGNARRLVKDHGLDLRYCHPWKKWLAWDGGRWKLDQTGEAIRRAKQTVARRHRMAEERVRRLAEELEDLKEKDPRYDEVTADLTKAEQILKHAKKTESAERLMAMLTLAQSEPGIPVSPEDFDRDPWLLNVRNGTIDLRTGELRPHRREDLITKLAPVEYDPEAQAPTWEGFLQKIMDDNAELIAFLRRITGYALTGRVTEQSLFFFHGSGANGKSTFLNTLQALLGDYAMQAPSDLIMVSKGQKHPTERADLYGMRLVACVEVDEGQKMAESLVKQLTGGERVRARRMREDFWEFDPTHKLFLAGNHKPTIRGSDEGIWRRVKLVPFTVSIPEDERDKNLPDKLRNELAGILAWAVRGCQEWLRDGLRPPTEVKEATDQYRDEMDDLSEFFEDCCVVGQGLKASASLLYKAFVAWSATFNGRRLKQTEFRAFMEGRGHERRRSGSSGGYEYHGLDLKDQFKAASK